MSTASSAQNLIMRMLPSVDELLRSAIGASIAREAGEKHAVALIRVVLDDLRTEIAAISDRDKSKTDLRNLAEASLNSLWTMERVAGTKRVINATGVVIHTNLGRAPFSDSARIAIAAAAGYCTLEYDTSTGKRGKRGNRAESLLAELTGAESVLVVNNCAAAAFFVLTAFAAGGEVIISRGEMVEIGGDFRVPDVLSQSGATLREVGTTNRTTLADYETAITTDTRLILRVHPSNYRIIGFTAMPSLGDLATLAHKNGIVIYEDIGSGALMDVGDFGLTDEPMVSESIAAGIDIVTFSGDKLLGGPQSGIIAGKAVYIDKLRKHPLYRALRVDKIVYAGLEATLESYRRSTASSDIPVIGMLSMSKDEIGKRASKFVSELAAKLTESGIVDLNCEISDGYSAVGGGAAPGVQLETSLVGLSHAKLSVSRLERELRLAEPPVITRIAEDKVMIDLRTVSVAEEAELLTALIKTAAKVDPPVSTTDQA